MATAGARRWMAWPRATAASRSIIVAWGAASRSARARAPGPDLRPRPRGPAPRGAAADGGHAGVRCNGPARGTVRPADARRECRVRSHRSTADRAGVGRRHSRRPLRRGSRRLARRAHPVRRSGQCTPARTLRERTMTALPATTDVVIVGAGPTGLVLGCLLAANGVSFVLVDRLAAGDHTWRAAVVHA